MPECHAAWVSDDIRAMTPAQPALRARRWSCPAGRPGSSSGAGARGGAGNARHLLPRGSSPHDAAAGPGRSHADRCAASPAKVTAGLAAGYPRDGDLSAIWRKRRLSRSTAARWGCDAWRREILICRSLPRNGICALNWPKSSGASCAPTAAASQTATSTHSASWPGSQTSWTTPSPRRSRACAPRATPGPRSETGLASPARRTATIDRTVADLHAASMAAQLACN